MVLLAEVISYFAKIFLLAQKSFREGRAAAILSGVIDHERCCLYHTISLKYEANWGLLRKATLLAERFQGKGSRKNRAASFVGRG